MRAVQCLAGEPIIVEDGFIQALEASDFEEGRTAFSGVPECDVTGGKSEKKWYTNMYKYIYLQLKQYLDDNMIRDILLK